MTHYKKYPELKLLLLTVAIFFLVLSVYAQEGGTNLPPGPNEIKLKLDEYFQESLLLDQLYKEDRLDAGSQGFLTRKDLEGGKVAVIRYGNQKAAIGEFPYSSWATREIERLIREELEYYKLDRPDPELTNGEKAEKQKLIRNIRRTTGYTVGEQREALSKKRRELERELTEAEKEEIKSSFPRKLDTQTDELEAFAIVQPATPLRVHHIFLDQNRYSKILPEYFEYSHLLTTEELKERKIILNPAESIFHAHYIVDKNTIIKYTVLNKWSETPRQVSLHTPHGDVITTIPRITTAWEIHKQFSPENHNEKKFLIEGAYVMDGYLILEPYIEMDSRGYHSVSPSKVAAVYHIYSRFDELRKDLSKIDPNFRLSEGRKFIKTMMSVIQGIIKQED